MRVPAATAAPSASKPHEAHIVVHVNELATPFEWLLWKCYVRDVCAKNRVTSFELRSPHLEDGKVVVTAREGRRIPHLDIVSHVRLLLALIDEFDIVDE